MAVIVAVIVAGAVAGLLVVRHWERSSGDRPASTESLGAIELKVGAQVPDFPLTPLEGGARPYSSLGKRVVLVNFWASWCPPCLVELPSLVKLREAYASRGFEVVGVNVDDDPEKQIPRFREKMGLTFPLYRDADQRLSELFSVEALPLTVILDAERRVLHFETGDRDWNAPEVRDMLEGWLAR